MNSDEILNVDESCDQNVSLYGQTYPANSMVKHSSSSILNSSNEVNDNSAKYDSSSFLCSSFCNNYLDKKLFFKCDNVNLFSQMNFDKSKLEKFKDSFNTNDNNTEPKCDTSNAYDKLQVNAFSDCCQSNSKANLDISTYEIAKDILQDCVSLLDNYEISENKKLKDREEKCVESLKNCDLIKLSIDLSTAHEVTVDNGKEVAFNNAFSGVQINECKINHAEKIKSDEFTKENVNTPKSYLDLSESSENCLVKDVEIIESGDCSVVNIKQVIKKADHLLEDRKQTVNYTFEDEKLQAFQIKKILGSQLLGKINNQISSAEANNENFKDNIPFFMCEVDSRHCSQCGRLIKDREKVLTWQTMEFCEDNCLLKYQCERCSLCAHCNSVCQANSVGKLCVRFGCSIKQFCTYQCLETYKRSQLTCRYCQRKVEFCDEKHFNKENYEKTKDFCSKNCFDLFERICAGDQLHISKCTECCEVKEMQTGIVDSSGTIPFCTDRCVLTYMHDKNMNLVCCGMCQKYFDWSKNTNEKKENWIINFSGDKQIFCSQACFIVFIAANRKIVICGNCKVRKYNFDMIEKVDINGQQHMYCSLLCMLPHQHLTPVANIECDVCHKSSQSFHKLVESNGLIKNVCSSTCMHKAEAVNQDSTMPSTKLGPAISITSSSSVQPVPKEDIQNMSLPNMLAPKMVANKMVSCKPLFINKEIQCHLDSDESKVSIPVPFFLPIPIPIPVPISIFVPDVVLNKNQLHFLKELGDIKRNENHKTSSDDVLQNVQKFESLSEAKGDITEEINELDGLLYNTNMAGKHACNTIPNSDRNEHANRKRSVSPSFLSHNSCPKSKKDNKFNNLNENSGNKFNCSQINEQPVDAKFRFDYGVSAWNLWVQQKNSDIQKATSSGSRKLKQFNADLLQLTSDKLNYSLCLFVKEVRKPDGDEYAPDSIYYLCLGLQQYLFLNGRTDNIFLDSIYDKFTDYLDEVSQKFIEHRSQEIIQHGCLVTRITEEYLWECKQLGVFSPSALLNTLLYYNTKYFLFQTVEEHLHLKFKQIKKIEVVSSLVDDTESECALHYYSDSNNVIEENERKCLKQNADVNNPIRCPVKLFEFYKSRCSVNSQNGYFYLTPDKFCEPQSLVWYSEVPLSKEIIRKMLNRILMVKEINEALLKLH